MCITGIRVEGGSRFVLPHLVFRFGSRPRSHNAHPALHKSVPQVVLLDWQETVSQVVLLVWQETVSQVVLLDWRNVISLE